MIEANLRLHRRPCRLLRRRRRRCQPAGHHFGRHRRRSCRCRRKKCDEITSLWPISDTCPIGNDLVAGRLSSAYNPKHILI